MPTKEINKPKILSQNLFPVVGIGASAGGLEAFKKLITAIPENSGMAYIIVQHLHPEHESALPEILQRVTKIPVIEISDNVFVNPNHIYVIPSNKMLVATDGVLKLSPRLAKDRNLPIDIFFSSLAEVHQGQSIGVILSGTGGDGTAGLRDIKNHGGLTFVQDPASAAYDGMPQHAIDADVVDFILPPEKISEKLMELQQSLAIVSPTGIPEAKDKINEDAFRQIIALLKVRVGVDFSFYKQTTVRRRIIRRLVILHLETITNYLEYLKKNKPELDILFNDLLIPVTSFFRDTITFDRLCETVFPEVLKNKSVSNPARIWIAGCSTGQEAYSVAICIQEYLSDHISNIKIQIFATDLSDISIKKARNGIYSKKELEGVSESRLNHFFNKTNGYYQVKKHVRDMCIFATHNFLKDPPFSKMDLITCRNVLIYLEPFLQKKALTTFHYALNDKRFLVLGKSEAIGSTSDLFIPFGNKDKFFSRKSIPGRFMNVATEPGETALANQNYSLRSKQIKTDDFQKNADDVLLSKYTPVGVVVNEQFDIVQFRGFTGAYLEPSPGKASLNVLKMAKEGLAFEIRNALHKSKSSGEPFIKEGISINDGKKSVTIEVVPLLNIVDLHFLILFREQLSISTQKLATSKEKVTAAKIKKDEKDNRILQLEKELTQAREDMRSVTEDQEASNEELQSSNEELLSGSEELQSLNEELETSKEELQSTNEELITVNQELYDRNEQLNQSHQFAETIISVLHESLLVLDKNFIIKTANTSFYEIFQLTEEETLGKNVFALQDYGWEIPELRKGLGKIQKEKEKEIEMEIVFTFPVIGERTICFNIKAISRESGEHLILLALDDITDRRNAEKVLEEKAKGILKEHQLLHGLLMESPALFAILKGPEYVFEFANTLYHQFTGNRNIIGEKLIEALPETKGQGFLELLDNVYKTGDSYIGNEMPVSIEIEKGKSIDRFLNFKYQRINDEKGNPEGILVFAYDVTEIVLGRKQLKRNAEMIQNLYMNAPAYVATLMGADHVYELVNPSYQKLFGTRQIQGKPIMEALPELKGQGFDKILDNVYNTGEIFLGNEVPIRLAYDEGLEPVERFFNFSYQPIYDEQNKITGILVFGYEVTEQMLAKKQIEASEKRVSNILSQSLMAISILKGREMEIISANDVMLEMWGKGKNVIGKPLFEVLSETKDQPFPKLLDDVYTTGVPFATNEIKAILVRNGKPEECYFNLLYQPYTEGDDIITGVTVMATEITEGVNARKQIEASEQRFSNILSQSLMAIAILKGPEMVVTFANEPLIAAWGKGHDIIGKPFLEILPEIKDTEFPKILQQVYTSGEPFYGYETKVMLIRNGMPEETYFNFVYQPYTEVDNTITGITIIASEVKEKVLAKKQIEESEAKFRALSETIPHMIWTALPDGNKNFFNKYYLDYTGLSFEELKDDGWQKIIFPADLEKELQQWHHSVHTGEDFKIEKRIRYHDGTYRWHLSHSIIQKDGYGNIIGWIGTSTDIDDQKKSSEKIRIAEEFSRTVLQSSPDCVKVLDKDGLIFFMNTNGLCLMEIDDFDMVKNKPWWELWGDENKPVIDAALSTALLGKTAQFEAYCSTAKGTPKWWDVIVSPLFGTDGVVSQLISVSRDITDRVKMEQKKDEFISIASHEMKTPLTTAKAYLQLLELSMDSENETANLYAKKASQSVIRLNDLITELLDASKIQHGKLDYNISTFNFNDMIDATVEDMQHTSSKHTIVKTGKVQQQVTGDKERLQQVIINLLSNAIKYSPDSLDVYINTEQSNDEIKVAIKDNGIGISQQHLEKIFDRYYRVHEHAVEFQGLGLGLFISYEIIQRHGGKIWAESEPGKGSTFYFTLPANKK